LSGGPKPHPIIPSPKERGEMDKKEKNNNINLTFRLPPLGRDKEWGF